MKLEQIYSFIANYEQLVSLVRSKIEVIEKYDLRYYSGGGGAIDSISFDDDEVLVRCYSSDDNFSFAFPIFWLSKEDDELKEIVLTEKALREENRRKEQLEQNKQQEQREFEQYKRLKAKFEKSEN